MEPVPAPAPHVFGKYTLVAKLAIGGMAEIFLARLQGAAGFEKLVCIKRILPHLAKDQMLVGMFLAEARIAAQITHPNVCQVFELGEIEGRYFIAMEYLEGVPFSCFRRRDMYGPPPDPRLIAGLGLQACEGLHHAHQLKKPDGTLLEVVHRDVSANNLFATVDGAVKVLDFGIAKVQDASVRTSTGSVKGTYAYMAPEQLRGERVDRRTDVFAIGIVLWELFARRHLFKRETDFLTFQAITQDPIPEVAELRPDVPPELSAAIARALSRNRDDRFPSARALGEALARSVSAIGGPWTAPQISDEIARAFEPRLRDQQQLIRVAREGGTLNLEDELGPSVGHGTELVTTPLSIISGMHGRTQSQPPPSFTAPVPPHAVSTMIDPGLRAQPPVHAAARSPEGTRSSVIEIAGLPPPPMPVAPRRSRVVPLLVLAVLLLGASLVAVLVTRGDGQAGQPPQVGQTPAAPPPPPTPAPAPAVVPADAGAAKVEPPPADAAAPPAEVPADAGQVATAPLTPAVAPPVRPTDRPARPAARPRSPTTPPAVAASKGPPGWITIDSSPVYAVIFIDGKRYGETPLVRIELPPGKHSVRAVSASGTSQGLSITIESGKVAPTRKVEW